MYQTIIASGSIEWVSLDFPGVEIKVLNRNEDIGSMAVLTRNGLGCQIPVDRHSKADESRFN
jgi:hypothetical protein